LDSRPSPTRRSSDLGDLAPAAAAGAVLQRIGRDQMGVEVIVLGLSAADRKGVCVLDGVTVAPAVAPQLDEQAGLDGIVAPVTARSEEHTSELQSREN